MPLLPLWAFMASCMVRFISEFDFMDQILHRPRVQSGTFYPQSTPAVNFTVKFVRNLSAVLTDHIPNVAFLVTIHILPGKNFLTKLCFPFSVHFGPQYLFPYILLNYHLWTTFITEKRCSVFLRYLA